MRISLRRTALVSVFLFAAAQAYSAEQFAGPYDGSVTRIIDGDTFEAMIKIWPDIEANVSVRIEGIDAPELRGSQCVGENLGAREAKDDLAELLVLGTKVGLRDVRADAFAGRIVATVCIQHQTRCESVQNLMLRRGNVVEWDGKPPKPGWC